MIKPKKLSKTKRAAAIAAAGLAVTAGTVGYLNHYNPPWQLKQVTKVVDGDTIKVDQAGAVRFIFI